MTVLGYDDTSVLDECITSSSWLKNKAEKKATRLCWWKPTVTINYNYMDENPSSETVTW
jgi:hypothetical protein